MLKSVRFGLVGLSMMALLGCGSESFEGIYTGGLGQFTFRDDGKVVVGNKVLNYNYDSGEKEILIVVSEGGPSQLYTVNEDGTLGQGVHKLKPAVTADFLTKNGGRWLWESVEGALVFLEAYEYKETGDTELLVTSRGYVIDHYKQAYAVSDEEFTETIKLTEDLNNFRIDGNKVRGIYVSDNEVRWKPDSTFYGDPWSETRLTEKYKFSPPNGYTKLSWDEVAE